MTNLYASQEAADYLGFTIHTLRSHVVKGNLEPSYRLGEMGFWVFTKETLDEFQSRRRGPGRPKKL